MTDPISEAIAKMEAWRKAQIGTLSYIARGVMRLVPMGLFALICLLAYGSLMLWAGFRIDTGRDVPLAAILHMPSGWLISGLCLAAGLFCGVLSAKSFVEEKKGIWKQGISALLLIFTGCSMFVYLITY